MIVLPIIKLETKEERLALIRTLYENIPNYRPYWGYGLETALEIFVNDNGENEPDEDSEAPYSILGLLGPEYFIGIFQDNSPSWCDLRPAFNDNIRYIRANSITHFVLMAERALEGAKARGESPGSLIMPEPEEGAHVNEINLTVDEVVPDHVYEMFKEMTVDNPGNIVDGEDGLSYYWWIDEGKVLRRSREKPALHLPSMSPIKLVAHVDHKAEEAAYLEELYRQEQIDEELRREERSAMHDD